MVPGPNESIYLWMYSQGLRGREIADVIAEASACHAIRQKDIENYYNGFYRYQNGRRENPLSIAGQKARATALKYSDYPLHPYRNLPNPKQRWVPCDKDNKPMIRWGRGCMSRIDAECWPGSCYVGENLKGCQFIVFDIDGDHDDELDLRTIRFFAPWTDMTHCLHKQELVMDRAPGSSVDLTTLSCPVSYHLAFHVDRVIPTMHFPEAHVDVVGNRDNSLRYWKTKDYNGMPMMRMTDEIWSSFMDYIDERRRG